MTEQSVKMDREAIDGFLGQRGTAVLSLAREDTPYARPVSYGYDAAAENFYLRLSFHPDSRKHWILDGPMESQLVIYDTVDAGWRSVIATGELSQVSEEEITKQVAEGIRQAELPLTEIIDQSPDTIEYHIFRLSVRELTGRTTDAT